MKDVIIALDFRNREEVLTFLDRFKEPVYVKVGKELFYAEGPSIVREIKALGHKVFLDLKFHDIPNTVQGAVRSAAVLDADMLNLHAMGGEEMMRGAMKELEGREKKPLLIAVTVLTSMDEETLKSELHVSLSPGRGGAFSGKTYKEIRSSWRSLLCLGGAEAEKGSGRRFSDHHARYSAPGKRFRRSEEGGDACHGKRAGFRLHRGG